MSMVNISKVIENKKSYLNIEKEAERIRKQKLDVLINDYIRELSELLVDSIIKILDDMSDKAFLDLYSKELYERHCPNNENIMTFELGLNIQDFDKYAHCVCGRRYNNFYITGNGDDRTREQLAELIINIMKCRKVFEIHHRQLFPEKNVNDITDSKLNLNDVLTSSTEKQAKERAESILNQAIPCNPKVEIRVIHREPTVIGGIGYKELDLYIFFRFSLI